MAADDLTIRILIKALNEASPVLAKVQSDLNRLRVESLKSEGQQISNSIKLEKLEQQRLTTAAKVAAARKGGDVSELRTLEARDRVEKRLAREKAERDAEELRNLAARERVEKRLQAEREASDRVAERSAKARERADKQAADSLTRAAATAQREAERAVRPQRHRPPEMRPLASEQLSRQSVTPAGQLLLRSQLRGPSMTHVSSSRGILMLPGRRHSSRKSLLLRTLFVVSS